MEFLGVGGGTGGVVVSGGNVPAFLTKLWTLVEDPETDPLICWSPVLTSPYLAYNMVTQPLLLPVSLVSTITENPAKLLQVSSVRQEDVKISTDEVNKILSDVQLMKGKQETIDSRIIAMKHENEALWREVASLRQKHVQQQKVVNKLIHFLVSLVQTNRILGVKRKIPLMLNDSISAHSMPKYSRPLTLEHIQNAAANLLSPDSPLNSGPIISDITEEAENRLTFIKEEPSSPEVEECPVLEVEQDSLPANVDTPLSPTTFINSILQEETQLPQTSFFTFLPVYRLSLCFSAPPVVVMSPASAGSVQSAPTVKFPASVSSSKSASVPSPANPKQKCQTIARLDRIRSDLMGYLTPVSLSLWLCPRFELSDHVDSIDNSLENLQGILNSQTFTFDPSPLMEFFSSSIPSADFDIESLDNLLSDEAPKESEDRTGKQLVQYTATPLHLTEPVVLGEGDADLPSLLEYETEPLFNSDAAGDDPPDVLLSPSQLDSNL
uniref:Vertebrate heat shock transcription factor C-terminal domain-containing protein n=1 Tax=Xiphophorus couchianus TaxID=32473 RepID=A0A3B5MZN2_9TELE